MKISEIQYNNLPKNLQQYFVLENRGKNTNPCVKPLKIFSYLITIASRPNDIVLDPFVGSGTAAISAKTLDRNYIGIDISEEYCKIAEARLKAYKKQKRMGDDL